MKMQKKEENFLSKKKLRKIAPILGHFIFNNSLLHTFFLPEQAGKIHTSSFVFHYECLTHSVALPSDSFLQLLWPEKVRK